MSRAAASPMPPATQWPAMRPTYGFGERWNLPNSARGSTSIPGTAEVRSARSAPAQKTEPLLVRTTTRTSGSLSAMSSAATSSPVSCRLNEFLRSSSARVMVITLPRRSVSTRGIRSSPGPGRRWGTGEGLGPEQPVPSEAAHHQVGVVQVAALGDDQAEALGGALDGLRGVDGAPGPGLPGRAGEHQSDLALGRRLAAHDVGPSPGEVAQLGDVAEAIGGLAGRPHRVDDVPAVCPHLHQAGGEERPGATTDRS